MRPDIVDPITWNIPIPKGFQPKDVAEIFTAYLMGNGAFINGDHRHGPFQSDTGTWQLDNSNDYWLRLSQTGKTMRLTCRYDTQGPILKAMVELYQLRFLPELGDQQ